MQSRNEGRLGFEDVRPEQIRAIRGSDFEYFCRTLLDVERFDRHTAALVRGPLGDSTADGGKDLVFEVLSRPKKSRKQYEEENGLALTEDDGATCYSCKSGSKWRNKVLAEANKTATGPAKAPVDYLLEGGHFTLLVNEPVAKERRYAAGRSSASARKAAAGGPSGTTLLQELAARLWAQMRKVSPDAPDPTPRIRILDADDLAGYVRRRRPIELGERHLSVLGVEDVADLKTIDFWRHDHEGEREWPSFVEDEVRKQLLNEIRQVLIERAADPSERVVRIQGPPGIGKTRVLLELFGGDDDVTKSLAASARVALSFQPGWEALDRYRVAERFPTLILVVDDCPFEEADRLVQQFVYQARNNRAVLVLVTPSGAERSHGVKKGSVRPFPLSPLGAEALVTLIHNEMGGGAPPELVERVRRFSEGYPYYAALIARGIGEDPAAPLGSAADAATLALASRSGSRSEAERRTLALERARCLLAAMLTEHVDWDDPQHGLSESDKADICQAVRIDTWKRLEELAEECVARGLLRMRLKRTYKYVTPLVLAREVALMLLSPPDGDPRTPIGPSIREHASRFAPMFYELLDRLELGIDGSRSTIAALARDVLDEIESGQDISILERSTLHGTPLRFAVRRLPARSAGVLCRLVGASAPEVLRERTDLRRDLVGALETLSRRKAGFQDAEQALFLLALAENEAFANNATSTWASLFLVELNPTYLTFEERLPLLRRRCTTGTAESRLVGLAGIDAAISAHATRFGGDEEDGPYATPTSDEAREARIGAWHLLLEATRDLPEVASRARKLVSEHLRDAVRFGIGGEVAELLIGYLSGFDPQSMLELREQIEHVGSYDRSWIDPIPEISQAWARLEAAALPRSFRERLRQRIGTWASGRDDDDDHAAVAAVASEAAHDPQLLLAELDWLESEHAVRAPDFFIGLGKDDASGSFLGQLVARARTGKAVDTLSWYLHGCQDAGRGEQVDEVLRGMQGDPALVCARVLTIPRVGATEARMSWLIEAITVGGLPDRIVGTLALGSWERTASDSALFDLANALATSGTTVAAATALTLAARRANGWTSLPPTWVSLLERLLTRLADEPLRGHADYHWSQAARLLVQAGRISTVLPLSLLVIGRDDRNRSSSRGWETFLACAQADAGAAWRGLASLLETKDAYRITLALRARDLDEIFPADAVLAWVGRHQERAAVAAELCKLRRDELSPLARGLLVRFGADSRAAAVLALKARTTQRMVHSLAKLGEDQLRRARVWEKDENANVRRWAGQLVRRLEEEVEAHGAYEEYSQRRWGT